MADLVAGSLSDDVLGWPRYALRFLPSPTTNYVMWVVPFSLTRERIESRERKGCFKFVEWRSKQPTELRLPMRIENSKIAIRLFSSRRVFLPVLAQLEN
jgi:hypothetical protein